MSESNRPNARFPSTRWGYEGKRFARKNLAIGPVYGGIKILITQHMGVHTVKIPGNHGEKNENGNARKGLKPQDMGLEGKKMV